MLRSTWHPCRYLQGAAHYVQMERPDEAGAAAASSSKGPAKAGGGAAAAAEPAPAQPLTPQALAVSLICRCDELPDEGVEVLVLRGLLTASTSASFTLHGAALLLAVRTAYNIHLTSRSEVNVTTAKATLTQMLNVVFQRMEARSTRVAVSRRSPAGRCGAAAARLRQHAHARSHPRIWGLRMRQLRMHQDASLTQCTAMLLLATGQAHHCGGPAGGAQQPHGWRWR